MWRALALQGRDRRQGCEQRVAVVRSAATVQLAIVHHRLPRPQAIGPTIEFRLLVVVAVHKHRRGGRGARGHFRIQQWRAPGQGHGAAGQATHGAAADPLGEQLDGVAHVRQRVPVRLEGWRLVGDADVVAQGWQDVGIPCARYELTNMLRIHGQGVCVFERSNLDTCRKDPQPPHGHG